jgi:hypothetical protein
VIFAHGHSFQETACGPSSLSPLQRE